MELCDQFIGMFGDIAQIEKTKTRIRHLLMFAQDHIFCNGEIFDHAVAHAFFGDIREHTICNIARCKVGDIFAFEKNFSRSYLAQAGDGFRQFPLTVAGNTRNAKNFT